jgi:hypothetical protein
MTNPLFDGEGFEFEHLLGLAAMGQREQQRKELAKLNASTSSREPSTQDIAVDGELDDSYFNMQSSEIEQRGRTFRFHYTLKIKKPGRYKIVAGKVVSKKHVPSLSASRIVNADAGDVFSGAIDTSSFDGIWAFAIHKA